MPSQEGNQWGVTWFLTAIPICRNRLNQKVTAKVINLFGNPVQAAA